MLAIDSRMACMSAPPDCASRVLPIIAPRSIEICALIVVSSKADVRARSAACTIASATVAAAVMMATMIIISALRPLLHTTLCSAFLTMNMVGSFANQSMGREGPAAGRCMARRRAYVRSVISVGVIAL